MKSSRVILNSAVNAVIFACSILSAVYAFDHAGAIKEAVPSAIAAMSVILGLSMAITALLKAAPTPSSNDPKVAKRIAERVAYDDKRTLLRQQLLLLLMIVSILASLAFLVMFKANPHAVSTKVLASFSTFLSTACLMSTLYLPRLLVLLETRNAYLRQNQKGTRR